MTKEEIGSLKESVAEDNQQETNHVFEEDAIATMAESEGWKIMMKKYRRKIAEFLEPIQHDDISNVKNLELIGAMAIARREKIDSLTEFVNEVESVRKARQKINSMKAEESKKEA